MGNTVNTAAKAETEPEPTATEKIDWAEVDWAKRLSPEEYRVLRERATEPRGSGEYERFVPKGGYFVCRGCGNPLFSAAAKFESGCGWAAFDRCYVNSVAAQADLSHGLARVEVVCRKCAGHLGHLFSGEALSESNQRHCVNSLSIRYVKDDPPPDLLTNGEARVDTASVDRLLASSAARSGAVSSVRPVSDLDLSSAALADAWALTRGRERGWLLCGYAAGSKVALVPTSHGEGGLDELRGKVAEDAVSYGVLPADVDGRTRYVFFTHIGERAPALTRGRAAMHAPHVERYFDGTVGALPALTSAAELEASHLDSLIAQLCKGAREAAVR